GRHIRRSVPDGHVRQPHDMSCALLHVERVTSLRIRDPRGAESSEPEAAHLDPGRDILRQPPYVGENPSHLVAVHGQGPAVHGSLETIIDPILERVDLAFLARYSYIQSPTMVSSILSHRSASHALVSEGRSGKAEHAAIVKAPRSNFRTIVV